VLLRLDRTDFEILAVLQKNARISNKVLAHSVNLAPSSCHERLKKLTAAGVVRGFHADIDPTLLGIGLQALVTVKLSVSSTSLFERLKEDVIAMEEYVALYLVSGTTDLLIHVAVRDADHLRDLILNRVASRDEVLHCETFLIFESHRGNILPIYQKSVEGEMR
jgi:DNA-binding Lrp family transcriptional regulator